MFNFNRKKKINEEDVFKMNSDDYREGLTQGFSLEDLNGEDVSIPAKELIKMLINELAVLHKYMVDLKKEGFGEENFDVQKMAKSKSAGEFADTFIKVHLAAGRLSAVLELLDTYSEIKIPEKIKELVNAILERNQ